MQEITLISDTILEELLSEVREYIWFLYQLSETVSTLDLLLSLAAVSMSQDFTKVYSSWFSWARRCLMVTHLIFLIPVFLQPDHHGLSKLEIVLYTLYVLFSPTKLTGLYCAVLAFVPGSF